MIKLSVIITLFKKLEKILTELGCSCEVNLTGHVRTMGKPSYHCFDFQIPTKLKIDGNWIDTQKPFPDGDEHNGLYTINRIRVSEGVINNWENKPLTDSEIIMNIMGNQLFLGYEED